MGGRQCRRGRPRAGAWAAGMWLRAVWRRFAARVLQTGNAAPALPPGDAPEWGQPPPTGLRAQWRLDSDSQVKFVLETVGPAWAAAPPARLERGLSVPARPRAGSKSRDDWRN